MEIQSSWHFVVKQLTCIYTLLLFVQMLDFCKIFCMLKRVLYLNELFDITNVFPLCV